MTKFLDEIEVCIPALRRYARALTGHRERADDLVQDTLERAIRKQSLWSPTGELQGWLFTILTNIYRNDLRAQKRAPHLTAIHDLSVEPLSLPEQPGQLALAQTKAAMERLPEDQKQILLLVALEGFSYKEVAHILQMPLGTVMSRLGRARQALREMTGDDQDRHLRKVK